MSLCDDNAVMTPTHPPHTRASNAESISVAWRHHEMNCLNSTDNDTQQNVLDNYNTFHIEAKWHHISDWHSIWHYIVYSTKTPGVEYSADCDLTQKNPYNARMGDDVIKRKYFPRYWPIVREIHRSPVNTLTKASDAGLWYFRWSAFSLVWINSWVNDRQAGDSICHCAFMTSL